MALEGGLQGGKVAQGGTRLAEEDVVGLEAEVEQGVVDMGEGHVALGQGDAEEGVFVAIVGDGFAEEDGEERGTAYHEVEGGEPLIGVLAAVVGGTAPIGTVLIGVAQAHLGRG